jgi:hypothetical protein
MIVVIEPARPTPAFASQRHREALVPERRVLRHDLPTKNVERMYEAPEQRTTEESKRAIRTLATMSVPRCVRRCGRRLRFGEPSR